MTVRPIIFVVAVAIAAWLLAPVIDATRAELPQPARVKVEVTARPGSDAGMRKLRAAALAELKRRGRTDPAGGRAVQIEVVVGIGAPEPGAAGKVRHVSLIWLVLIDGRLLGQIGQGQWIPASADTWRELACCAVGPAVQGILALIDVWIEAEREETPEPAGAGEHI